jgi:hypothetical protein
MAFNSLILRAFINRQNPLSGQIQVGGADDDQNQTIRARTRPLPSPAAPALRATTDTASYSTGATASWRR